MEIQDRLAAALAKAAADLRAAAVAGDWAAQAERLAAEVYEPCVLAVVGQVKAGKSSFINALLGADLAKVGTTETTATINYFRYGSPPDADRPVRCHWRNGQVDNVSFDFLDSLQGNDAETLRRADGIDHLEYFLPSAALRDVTLVDTPGTNAVVEEHEERISEFVHLERQLREHHAAETQRIGSAADAVLYVIGVNATEPDRDFLERFREVSQGGARALNAMGVMTKIDLYPALIPLRDEFAGRAARALRDNLTGVIPVSAGIARALQTLTADDGAGMERLVSFVRGLDAEQRAMMLKVPQLAASLPGYAEAKGAMDRRVFTTIAEIAADPDLSAAEIVARAEAIAGFDRVRAELEKTFFKRGKLLRCFRIVTDARRIAETLKYGPLLRRAREDRRKRERFTAFIRTANGDPAVAAEIEAYFAEAFDARSKLGAVIEAMEWTFAALWFELEGDNRDFGALQQLETHRDAFSDAERDELEALLGLRGSDTTIRLRLTGAATDAVLSTVVARQLAWQDVRVNDAHAGRRDVADAAVARLGRIVDAIAKGQTAAV